MKYAKIGMVGLLAASTVAVDAAEILRLSGSASLNDINYWSGGVAPGSSDVALFDGTSGAGGTTYSTTSFYPGGWKFTDIDGPVTISNYGYVYGSGIDMSSATADVSFTGQVRVGNVSFGNITVASGRTLTINNINTSNGKSAYTIGISGGGTMLVNGTATATSSRMMFNVSGAGTTIGGTGTYAAYWSNSGYGVQIGSGSYIAPGTTGIGTLTIDDTNGGATALILADGSGLKMELGAAGSSDMLALTAMAAGDVVFQGTTIIDLLDTGEVGTYKLIDTDLDETTWTGLTLSGQEITGGLTVANLADGLSSTLYMGDGSNGDAGDIYLTVIPEPATMGLMGIFGAGMLFVRRKFMM